MGSPKLLGGGAFRVVGRAVAARGARLLRRRGDHGFQFGVDADARDTPALGLDARPLVERGAVHGRVVGQLGRLDEPGPRLLFGYVAGVYRRPVRGALAALGGGQHLEGVATGPGRLVFLNQPGADHVVHAAPGGVGVAVKMFVGQVFVGHGSIQPHVGDGRAGPLGAGAPVPVARVGLLRAGGVFPPMAGPLVAGPVLAGVWWVVMAWRAWSRLVIRRGVRARRLGRPRRGCRGLLTKEIQPVKHGHRLAADT